MFGKRRFQQQPQQKQQLIVLKRNGRTSSHRCRCIPRNTLRTAVIAFVVLILCYFIVIHNVKDVYYYDYYTNSNSLLTLSALFVNNSTFASFTSNEQEQQQQQHQHKVAGLSCQIYGGPTSDEAIHEMIYWYNIPSDTNYFHQESHKGRVASQKNTPMDDTERYLTFEPDEGGWNNIRMALETTIAIAISMRRTLVLPPDMKFYLLWNDKKKNSNSTNQSHTRTKNVMNFDDFFHLESIQRENSHVLRIISMEEFLLQVGMTGQLHSRSQNVVRYPNRTNWSASSSSSSWAMNNYESVHRENTPSQSLWEYIRDVTQSLLWDSDACVAVFPSSEITSIGVQDVAWNKNENNVDADTQRQLDFLQQVLQKDQKQFGDIVQQLPPHKRRFVRLHQLRQDSYRNHPTPVNATATERLAELLADRKQLCIYNQSMHQQFKVLHMTGSETAVSSGTSGNNHHSETTSNRFLIHFYAFLFYENYHTDLFIKRFIRDHLRYIDEIQCGAARIIEAIRNIARSNHNFSNDTTDNISQTGQYDSFHIRRGDFQYDLMHLSAPEIYEGTTRAVVPDGRTVYIATDETNMTFFQTFQQHYNILFLHNFTHLIPDINPNYYGMIEQLVASKSEVFVGTFYSTFSAYINRIRGYHAQKNQLPGYELGHIQSYYYVPGTHEGFRTVMQNYVSVQQAFWQQEFPVAWRDINHDVTKDMIE